MQSNSSCYKISSFEMPMLPKCICHFSINENAVVDDMHQRNTDEQRMRENLQEKYTSSDETQISYHVSHKV